MTDTEKLNKAIKNSGLKISFLADKLGLSSQGFYNKINGKTEFYSSEILILSDILGLTFREREEVFFAAIVDKKET